MIFQYGVMFFFFLYILLKFIFIRMSFFPGISCEDFITIHFSVVSCCEMAYTWESTRTRVLVPGKRAAPQKARGASPRHPPFLALPAVPATCTFLAGLLENGV